MELEDILETVKRLESLVQFAETKFNRKFKCPTLSFQLSGGCAGVAHLRENHIRLNPFFCKNGYKDYVLVNTLVHELSHLIAYQLYNERGHGNAWKIVMRSFGMEPNRCHSMPRQAGKRQ